MAQRYRSPGTKKASSWLGVLFSAALLSLVSAYLWNMLGTWGEVWMLGLGLRAITIGFILNAAIRLFSFANSKATAAFTVAALLVSVWGGNQLAAKRARSAFEKQAAELAELRLSMGVSAETISHDQQQKRRKLLAAQGIGAKLGWGESPPTYWPSQLLGPSGGSALLALEFCLAICAALYFPMGQASEPICQSCLQWLEIDTQYSCAYGKSSEFIGGLCKNDDSAFELLQAPDTKEKMQLQLYQCAHCGEHPPVLRVVDFSVGRSGHSIERHRADLQLQREESLRLIAALEEAKS